MDEKTGNWTRAERGDRPYCKAKARDEQRPGMFWFCTRYQGHDDDELKAGKPVLHVAGLVDTIGQEWTA